MLFTFLKVILIGLKSDLRKRENCVSRSDGEKTAKRIMASGYLECSAKTQDGLYDVFDMAIKVMLIPQGKMAKLRALEKCTIL
jgi:GTPase SAR1 family protein